MNNQKDELMDRSKDNYEELHCVKRTQQCNIVRSTAIPDNFSTFSVYMHFLTVVVPISNGVT